MRDCRQGLVVILDWGYSVNKDDGPQYFAGGLECSADDVLKAININEEVSFVYEPQFDLVSFVSIRTFYMSLYGTSGVVMLEFGRVKEGEKKMHVESVISHWEEHCSSKIWKDIISCANACS